MPNRLVQLEPFCESADARRSTQAIVAEAPAMAEQSGCHADTGGVAPVAVAMSGGVDSSTVAAMMSASGRANHWIDDAALESAALAAVSER